MKNTLYFIVLLCLSCILSSCQFLQDSEGNREARCKEIKSQMMLNSATTMESQAFQARSEQGKLNESYHENGCI